MQKLGEKIALLIKARGRQQKDFARDIGYSAEHLSRLLKSDTLPPKALHRIAQGLDIAPEQLGKIEIVGDTDFTPRVAEPGVPYATSRPPTVAAAVELENLRREIGRLQVEVERLTSMLAREQALSADLAEALKRLSGK